MVMVMVMVVVVKMGKTGYTEAERTPKTQVKPILSLVTYRIRPSWET